MQRFTLLVLLTVGESVAFQSFHPSLRREAGCAQRRKSGVCSLTAAIDRRGFLAGALLTQVTPASANDSVEQVRPPNCPVPCRCNHRFCFLGAGTWIVWCRGTRGRAGHLVPGRITRVLGCALQVMSVLCCMTERIVLADQGGTDQALPRNGGPVHRPLL